MALACVSLSLRELAEEVKACGSLPGPAGAGLSLRGPALQCIFFRARSVSPLADWAGLSGSAGLV